MENNYKKFLEDISDGCAILVDRFVVFINRRFGEILGYDPDKIIGASITEFIKPDEIQPLEERYERVIQGEETALERFEVAAIKEDGNTIIVEISAKLMQYDNKSAVCIIARDITERKLEKEELSIFYNAVEGAADAIIITDMDGIILYANSTTEVTYGYKNEDVIGKPAIFFNPYSETTREMISAIKTTGHWHGEVNQVKNNGNAFPALISLSQIKGAEGNLVAIMGTVKDITGRKRMEEELLSAQKYAQNLIDRSLDMIISVDSERRIVEFNLAAQKTFGYTKKEVLGQYIDILYADPEIALEASELTRKTGRYTGEVINKRKNGETFISYLAASILLNEEGNFIGVMGVSKDITDRKYAEEKYRQLLEDMNDGYIVVNFEGQVVFSNERFSQMFGYHPEEVRGKQLAEFIDPNGKIEEMEYFKKVIYERHTIERRVSQSVKKDGTKITTESSINFIQYDGKPAIGVIVRDITKRKKMEEEIQLNYETQTMLNTLLKVSLEDIPMEEILKRSLSIAFSIFPSNLEVYGAIFLVEDKPDILVRKAYSSCDDSARGICSMVPVGKCLCGLAAKTGEIQFADHSDNLRETDSLISDHHSHYIIPILSSRKVLGVMTIYLKEGHIRSRREEEILGSVANVLSGIIERKQAEVILRQSEEKLSLIFESVPEGILITDLDGRIIDINTGAIHMHEYNKKDELIGQSIFKLFAERDRVKGVEDMNKTLQTGSMGLIYHTSIKKDNSSFPSAMNAVVLKDANGLPTGFIIIIVDATEPRKMQDRLIIADRLASLGEMVSGIAHELNNPLGAVLGLSQLMQSKELPDDIKEDVNLINRETVRAVSIVKNLLSFARKKEMVRQPVQVNSIIDSVLEIRAYEQKTNNIRVITELAQDLPPVKADASQLQQVFLNIVINAEYFMIKAHNEGNLTITTKLKGNTVRTSFTDDGPGIANKDLKIVFNPFFTTKDIGKGTGLGLSISHGIISDHGGKIFARSKPGKGATFIVELPVETSS